MKNLIILNLLLIPFFGFSQVAIGKTSVSSNSVSLEFGDENRGMILPWVIDINTMTTAVDGTIVYNLDDKKVKVKYAAGWKDLSDTGTTVDPTTSVDGVAIQNSENENGDAKVSIGTPTSTPGILVLEDTDKAMVLPQVADPHLNIMNPAPGMMVYDKTKKLFAVFNGSVWSYWRP